MTLRIGRFIGCTEGYRRGEHRRDYLDAGAFKESKSRDYYNEFSGTTEKDVGRPKIDGCARERPATSSPDCVSA